MAAVGMEVFDRVALRLECPHCDKCRESREESPDKLTHEKPDIGERKR